MSLYVWYVGPATSHSITAAQWVAKGAAATKDTSWDEGNSWSVDQGSLSSAQLAILAQDSSFSLNHGGLQPRPTRTNSGPAEAQYNATARSLYEKTKAAADSLNNTVSRQRVQITDNCYVCPNDTTSLTASNGTTTKLIHTVGVSAVDIQLMFSNTFRGSGGLGISDGIPGTSVTFSAAIIDPVDGSTILDFTFDGGNHSKVLAGGGQCLSDILPYEVVKGQYLWVAVSVSAGSFYYHRVALGVDNSGGYASGDQTLPGSGGAYTTAFFGAFTPCAIIGTPVDAGIPAAFIVQGDSIAVATQDSIVEWTNAARWPSRPELSAGGWHQRVLSGKAGVAIQAYGGESLYQYRTSVAHKKRASVLRYGKRALLLYGRNDITAGQTAVQLQTNLVNQAKDNAARGIIDTTIATITPYTTSTDFFATLANQTINPAGNESVRLAHNAWIRDGGPIDPTSKLPVATGSQNAIRFGNPAHPIYDFLDVAAAVEDSTVPGKWKVTGRSFADAAINTGTKDTTSVAAAFTNADIGKSMRVQGAGPSGLIMQDTIASVVGNVATCWGSANTTVTAARGNIGATTFDGIHPAPDGHAAIAAAVQAKLLAKLG